MSSPLVPINAVPLTGIGRQPRYDGQDPSTGIIASNDVPHDTGDPQLSPERLNSVDQPNQSGPLRESAPPIPSSVMESDEFGPAASMLTLTSDARAYFAAFVSASATT